jgi:CHAT domain/SIR2-like domain
MQPLVDGYDDFRLRIDSREGLPYHVLASTRSAEASANFEAPFADGELDRLALRARRGHVHRGAGGSALDDARRIGGALFTALFHDRVYGLYRDALAQARERGRGVRITLCLSGSPELMNVPWEYLFDEPDFLSVSALTPVVRYLDLPRGDRPLAIEPPLRLLGLVSSPAEYDRLDVERERDNLQRAVSGLTDSGVMELDWLERPTLAELLKALQAKTFHAIHYVGHASYDPAKQHGILLLEDADGWARPISGEKLGMVLHDFSSLRLAVLNACEGARSANGDPFAGVAGSLVRHDIPAVVAMQSELSDEAAIAFAGGFYRPLAAGIPVDASLSAARVAMLAEHSEDVEWGTPVLFMRVSDGRIFDLPSSAPPMVRAVPPADGASGGAASASARVLLNYRAEDAAGHARLLRDRLAQHFGRGNVEFDADHGVNFDADAARPVRGTLAPRLRLVLIGPAWLSTLSHGAAGRQAQDPARRLLESALRDSPERVVPVLIDAAMPDPESVPRSLRALCRLECSELRDTTFEQDLASLISRLERLATSAPLPRRAQRLRLAPRPPSDGETSDAAPAALAAGIAQPYPDHYLDVVNGILDGTVVALLGVGVSDREATANSLASLLSAPVAARSRGLAEIAQRVAVTLGERRLYSEIKELTAARSEPTEVHAFFAALPGLMRDLGLPERPQLIITTAYDSALERAFEAVGEPFDYAVYLASSGWFVHVPWGERAIEPGATTIREPRRYVGFPIDDDGQLERTIIVKIHGGVDGHEGAVAWRNNYVATEDHYIDYLPTHNIQEHLPIQLLDKLTGSRCLFLGYPLSSWDARVFLRRIWRGHPMSENSWAIDEHPDVVEKASWSMVGHVELLGAALPEYVHTLRSSLSERSRSG